MSKHQQRMEFSVSWFDKHYSPSKKFRKRELEASAQTQDASGSARFHQKLDMTWNQKYLQNFGRLPGMDVPDRRSPQSVGIKSNDFNMWPSSPSQGSTWVGGCRSLGGTLVSSPKKAVPQLQLPEKRPDSAPDGQRPQPRGCTDQAAVIGPGRYPTRPQSSGGVTPTVSSASPVSTPSASNAERMRQAAGLTRASSAPCGLGSGPLFDASCSSPLRRVVPPTSNQRYGWIETPKHLAYKPKPKVRAEEVVYKELTIIKGIPYSPRIRFTGCS